MRYIVSALAIALLAGPAAAEFQKITSATQFAQTVAGKTLTRPLVELTVTPDGGIAGMGAAWEVTGQWRWQDGYFCRDLFWGGTDLGFNCQEVQVNRDRIRFTSDRGEGQSAVFRLR
jgi:hypothetical protein